MAGRREKGTREAGVVARAEGGRRFIEEGVARRGAGEGVGDARIRWEERRRGGGGGRGGRGDSRGKRGKDEGGVGGEVRSDKGRGGEDVIGVEKKEKEEGGEEEGVKRAHEEANGEDEERARRGGRREGRESRSYGSEGRGGSRGGEGRGGVPCFHSLDDPFHEHGPGRPRERLRLWNSQHQQARDRRCSGVEGPVRQVAVRDGEHDAVGNLAQNARRQALCEHVAVLAPFHEVGEELIDWPSRPIASPYSPPRSAKK